jgi:hypothetical protein
MSVKATGTEEHLTLHFGKEVAVDVQKIGELTIMFRLPFHPALQRYSG